jgi:hypothetical protein
MTKEGQDERRDRLGKLLATYSARTRGYVFLALAIVLGLFGVLCLRGAAGMSRALFDDESSEGFYVGLGWFLIGTGALFTLLSPLYLLQKFEVRKKGVRHRRWRGTRELFWGEIERIEIQKETILTGETGRTTTYTITFHAEDTWIYLGAGFLASVNAFALIEVLKLHSGRPFDSDDESLATNDLGSARGPRRRKSKEKSSGEVGVYQQASARLARGAPAAKVEDWLVSQGIPSAAARGMVDKILTTTVRHQSEADKATTEEEPVVREARAQLAAGTDPEKVKRWLREQGVAPNMAGAIVADLRQQLR